jgi:hypothetical protein
MSIGDEVEYNQISEDWRHRDNLTWQIPSVIVGIGGALIAAAFALDIDPQIRPILLGFGALLSLCLTFALIQNLWYQVGSGEALIKIINGQRNKIPKDKARRTLNPTKDFDISKWNFIKRLFTTLAGSTFLVILCIGITFILFILFICTL